MYVYARASDFMSCALCPILIFPGEDVVEYQGEYVHEVHVTSAVEMSTEKYCTYS